MANTKPKMYVLDTSSILDDPECITKCAEGGNIVCIPHVVSKELDNHAKSDSLNREPAREANNIFFRLREQKKFYRDPEEALSGKETLENGGKVTWVRVTEDILERSRTALSPVTGRLNNDDIIIACGRHLKQKFNDLETIIISEDINLCNTADAMDVPAQRLRMSKDDSSLYEGYAEIKVGSDVITKLMNSGPELKKQLSLSDLKSGASSEIPAQFYWNQGIVLIDAKDPANKVVTRYDAKKEEFTVLQYAYAWNDRKDPSSIHSLCRKNITGMKPKDERQMLYVDFLLDPTLELVAAPGVYGSGKTRLLMACAVHEVLPDFNLDAEPKRYRGGILLLRPEYAANREGLGFLPGTKEEKLMPFFVPFFGAIEGLADELGKPSKKIVDRLLESDRLRFEASHYIRGHDISNTFVCVDESQNGNRHFARLVMSRMARGTKVVFTGDIDQIDNPYVDKNTNAVARVARKVRRDNLPIGAAITLTNVYRGGASVYAKGL